MAELTDGRVVEAVGGEVIEAVAVRSIPCRRVLAQFDEFNVSSDGVPCALALKILSVDGRTCQRWLKRQKKSSRGGRNYYVKTGNRSGSK